MRLRAASAAASCCRISRHDARLLHHATNAADLPFDAVKAGSEVLLQRGVQHEFLASSASALTLYASSSSRVDVRARTPNIAHTSSSLFAPVTTVQSGCLRIALDEDRASGRRL